LLGIRPSHHAGYSLKNHFDDQFWRANQRRVPALPAGRSPDFNPIEQLFAKLKVLLRKPVNVRSPASGAASPLFSMPSHPQNAPIISATRDTLHNKWKPL
jgi:hypothetical protein